MQRVKVAVVEDEVLFAVKLCACLEELDYEVLEPATTYSEGLSLIQAENPDILITDIGLAGSKSGIDLALKIRKEGDLPIIFLTSFSDKETIDKAKTAQPNAYLVKPFKKEELYSAIEIAIFNFQSIPKKPKKIREHFVKLREAYVKIKEEDIIFVKSDHVYLEINTVDEKRYVIRKSISEYLNELGFNFVRVHKSFIVNSNYIERLENESVIVKGIGIPVSRTYRESLTDVFKGR